MNAVQLTVYLDNLTKDIVSFREALASLDKEHKQTLQLLNDTRREFEKDNALLKREIEELKKWKDDQKKERDEKSRRLWAFGPNIAGAVVTASLSIIISLTTILIVTYFKTQAP